MSEEDTNSNSMKSSTMNSSRMMDSKMMSSQAARGGRGGNKMKASRINQSSR